MRQIHQHLFQDVYAWAGEPRNVPMTKHDTAYAEPADMNSLLREQYTSLAAQHRLRGINDREEFTRKLAGFWGEINHGHAFREGNTRSQTVFFEQLAQNAGWSLDIQRLSPHHPESVYKPFVDARFEHQRIRGVNALSAEEAALDLANVLYALIEADTSPEGRQRRGAPALDDQQPAPREAVRIISQDPDRGAKLLNHIGIKVDADGFLDFSDDSVQPAPNSATIKARHARHPELREMALDPYGLGEGASQSHSPDSESGYQP